MKTYLIPSSSEEQNLSTFKKAIYWGLIAPVAVGHYLVTLGSSTTPIWAQKYDNFCRRLVGLRTYPIYDENLSLAALEAEVKRLLIHDLKTSLKNGKVDDLTFRVLICRAARLIKDEELFVCLEVSLPTVNRWKAGQTLPNIRIRPTIYRILLDKLTS